MKTATQKRRVSFEQAKAQYVHRFTMEHAPVWSQFPPSMHGGTETRYYAPQYRSDREWYENTIFPGEDGYPFGKRRTDCYTTGQTWPLGHWLEKPYRVGE